MKKFTKVLSILVLGLSFCAGLSAQTNTATADASATIISAISISNTADLNFGQIIADADGGTVVVTSNPVGQTPTGVVLGPLNAYTVATFDVVGGNNCTYSINLPTDGTVTIDDAGAGDPMDVDTFTDAAAAGTLGTLSATGTQTIRVGATLHINAAQAAGSYTGTFDVTVNYL